MSHWLDNDDLAAAVSTRSTWSYWRPRVPGIVELALVHGVEVALPDHFHAEDQITFVMRGQRRFVVGRHVIELAAGEGACIPAGTPHRSLPQPLGVTCINVYVRPGDHDATRMIHRMAAAWRAGGSPLHALSALDPARQLETSNLASPLLHDSSAESVQAAARAHGMSREAYSRAFRRAHGMSPQAFGMMSRLNSARQLLRDDTPAIEAALMTGFADQSHLGRCFRRAFGTTPGRYRAGA